MRVCLRYWQPRAAVLRLEEATQQQPYCSKRMSVLRTLQELSRSRTIGLLTYNWLIKPNTREAGRWLKKSVEMCQSVVWWWISMKTSRHDDWEATREGVHSTSCTRPSCTVEEVEAGVVRHLLRSRYPRGRQAVSDSSPISDRVNKKGIHEANDQNQGQQSVAGQPNRRHHLAMLNTWPSSGLPVLIRLNLVAQEGVARQR